MKDNAEKQMIVGYGITVDGRIDNCDRLVLDGNMNCELHNVKSLIISQSGFFKGKGNIEQAEISGRFEGELTVDGHITIMESGKVDGMITYESIEIKPGGKFTGQIILKEQKPAGSDESEANSSDQVTSSSYLDSALKGRIMGSNAPASDGE
ncbi:MAG: polymer-forming cytoskeletal protein [Puniceicoccaceae bacterium]